LDSDAKAQAIFFNYKPINCESLNELRDIFFVLFRFFASLFQIQSFTAQLTELWPTITASGYFSVGKDLIITVSF
jgi:hypothetical protein